MDRNELSEASVSLKTLLVSASVDKIASHKI
jgi:hypothetical protein